MLVNVCEASHYFELPEWLPYVPAEDIESLECLSVRWEQINNPTLFPYIDMRVKCRREMSAVNDAIVFNDFSVDADWETPHPLEVGNYVVVSLEVVDYAGIVRSLCGESVEIEYFDTQTGELDTVEVHVDCVEVIVW